MSRNICFVSNTFGRQGSDFYAGLLSHLRSRGDVSGTFLCLTQEEALYHQKRNHFDRYVVVDTRQDVWSMSDAEAIESIRSRFPAVEWSRVVASERSFTDYSLLVGGGGDRPVTAHYVWRLVASLADALEAAVEDADLLVCQSPDTLLSMMAIEIASHRRVPCRMPTPAWVVPYGGEGGFLAADEFLHCPEMLESFRELEGRQLDDLERAQVLSLRQLISGFTGTARAYEEAPGRVSGRSPLSPHALHPFRYIKQVRSLDDRVTYTKPDPLQKAMTNARRLSRNIRARRHLSSIALSDVPERSIYLPLHFQPEQSTLAQGVWFTNQIALVESISKALPWGYTLVVKEHPIGLGSRPTWQYRHLSRLYNVEFCDALSRDLIKSCKAMITVSGTAALESIVSRRPAVMMGGNFFDFFPGIVKCGDLSKLPAALELALSLLEPFELGELDDQIDKALAAYSRNLIPALPFVGREKAYADAIAVNLEEANEG